MIPVLDQLWVDISVEVDGGYCNFLDASDGVQVSTYTFHTMFEPHENS